MNDKQRFAILQYIKMYAGSGGLSKVDILHHLMNTVMPLAAANACFDSLVQEDLIKQSAPTQLYSLQHTATLWMRNYSYDARYPGNNLFLAAANGGKQITGGKTERAAWLKKNNWWIVPVLIAVMMFFYQQWFI